MTGIEKVEAAWAAASVTEESARIVGSDRSVEIQACEERAILAAWEMRNDKHPLDDQIASERDKALSLCRPVTGQWFTDRDRVNESRMLRCVVVGLLFVRRGVRPTKAAELIHHIGRELDCHLRDAAELRLYHCVRLAGLVVT